MGSGRLETAAPVLSGREADTPIVRAVCRPHVRLEVLRCANEPEKRRTLVRLLQRIEGTGIVYAASGRRVELLHDMLRGMGFQVAKHHGRMAPRQRRDSERLFMAGGVHAIVATHAYDVAGDKTDVRFVIHYSTPESLDVYYREIARAGRDGKPARCALLYGGEDPPARARFAGGRYPTREEIRAVYHALARLGAGGGSVAVSRLKQELAPPAPKRMRMALALLKDLGVAKERRGSKVTVLRPDLDGGELDDLAARYTERHAAGHEKLNRMVEYAQSARCRWKFLLEYFGETADWGRCGACDNCLPLSAG